ncbi:MAG: glycosyltransferase family 4 protein [Candidatus Competibacterales bacterium]
MTRRRGNCHIGVDARTVFAPNRRGTGKNLVDLYQRLATLEPQWRFTLFYEPMEGVVPPAELDLANVFPVPLTMRGARFNLWEQGRLPWAAWRWGVDVLHSPAQSAPRFAATPSVVTVHDLIPLRFDEGWPAVQRRGLVETLAHSVRGAREIITVSRYTRDDLLKAFPTLDPQRVHVVPWAPEDGSIPVTNPAALEAVRRRYGVHSHPFWFALGARAPRKNTRRLLESFAQFAPQYPTWQLVVGGLQVDALEDFNAHIAPWSCRERIHLHPYLPEADLPALYSAAAGFVFPSLFEGFGLPVLDAMACGCPVLASEATSIPEVAGDGALYFDPLEAASMAGALAEAAGSEALRRDLAERGRRRVAHFQWERTAQLTRDVLGKALGG